MDFGDILNQWENQKVEAVKKQKESGKNQVSHKKANAPTPDEKEAMRQGYSYEQQMEQDSRQRINPMELWLRRYGTIDKDKENDRVSQIEQLESREHLRTMRPDATVDLHGLTREEAEKKLDRFVADCLRRGLKKILIIHGKGIHSNGSDPVLGEMVRKFIETDKRLGSSGHPGRAQGGSGATWVILRS